MNWFEELDDPKAKEFVARWRAKFPNETYINDMGQNAYAAVYLYKKLVEMAGSTKLGGYPQADRHRQGLHRCAGGQGLHRPKSQHVAHRMWQISVDADAQCEDRAFLGSHRALLAGPNRLRPYQERPEGAVHAEQPAQEVIGRSGQGAGSFRLLSRAAVVDQREAKCSRPRSSRLSIRSADVFAFLVLAAAASRSSSA